LPTVPHQIFVFGQHATQRVSLTLTWKIDALLSEYPQITLMLQYAKRNPVLGGFRRAHQLALEAVRRPLNNDQHPPSIHFQRAENKAEAISNWSEIYSKNPRLSQAYNSALVTPPDGKVHQILRIASTGLRKNGQTFIQHVSRETQSTLMRLITGHAFLGAYRLKFPHKNLPPATEEEVACACGQYLRTRNTSYSTAPSHTTNVFATWLRTGCQTRYENFLTARGGAWACYVS